MSDRNDPQLRMFRRWLRENTNARRQLLYEQRGIKRKIEERKAYLADTREGPDE